LHRRAFAFALVPLIVLLCAVSVREYVKGGVVTSDTLQLLDGTAAMDACLHAGRLRCHLAVSFWPPLQYIPALALKRIGASRATTENALIYLNGVAVLVTLALLWIVGRRSRAPGIAPLLVLAGLVSPLLWYGDSGFGEALAAAATTTMVVSILLGWNGAVTAFACCLAVISKETALPFVVVFGAAAIALRLHSTRSFRSHAIAIAGGAAAGVALIAALNLFRYGVPWNRYYLRSGWEVKSASRRAEFFAAELVAPNAGLVWFWPVASAIVAACGYFCARTLRATHTLRGRAGALAAALVAFLLLLATFASWWSPFGWFALGGRLIVPWVPALLALCAAAAAEPVYAAFGRLARSLPVLVATTALVIVLGLAELGAMLDPLRPFALFNRGGCRPVAHLLERIPAGDATAHAAEDACLSERAWRERSVLEDTLHALGGANAWFATLYVFSVVGLVAAAAFELDGVAVERHDVVKPQLLH
jgi:hypothetical protein